ncbi:MAG TPA: ribonuclease P protein component [Candidatus Andersenbacteria bacterium]|nr:ribonuclease P protein component [Candidatus Andersenbacteria bacterium]
MMKPPYRLRSSHIIRETLRYGARSRLSYGDIYTAPSADAESVAIACIVGKRVHASSVVRHAIQRRVRAACGKLIPLINGPYVIVIVVSDSVVLDMDFQVLMSDIYYAIQ